MSGSGLAGRDVVGGGAFGVPRTSVMGGSVVGSWAGGVAALILLGTVAVGLTVSARTARSFAEVRAAAQQLLRAPTLARLRAGAKEIASRVTEAEAEDDWSGLQRELPRRAAADPELLALLVTDEDGLVLAGADADLNGLPVHGDALRERLLRDEAGRSELSIAGTPGVLVTERVRTPEGRARVVALVGSIAAEQAVDAALAGEAAEAQRMGWILVVLGGVLCAAVAVGAVVLVGGSIARRLHVVAWRISELGRGDRGTHVRLGGPAELEHVEHELERAAQRIAGLSSGDEVRLAAESARQVVRGLLSRDGAEEQRHGAIVIRSARELTSSAACTFAARPRPDGTVLLVFVEVLGGTIADALLAAELRSAALALAGDATLGPAAVLARLDEIVGPEHRARATAVQLASSGTLRLASAGGRFPVQHRGEGVAPLVVRGDRLGEPGAERGAELDARLGPDEKLELAGEAQVAAGDTRGPALTVTLSLAA